MNTRNGERRIGGGRRGGEHFSAEPDFAPSGPSRRHKRNPEANELEVTRSTSPADAG